MDKCIDGMGLVHLYYGEGKGKTTAAMGQIVRAAGRGFRVLLFQFLKDNDSGERLLVETIPNITCLRGMEQVRFSFLMNEEEKQEAKEFYKKRLQDITAKMTEYDVVCMDEIVTAVSIGFLEREQVLEVIENRPAHTELILTGHEADEVWLAYADYATRMKKEKHPFDSGQKSRVGIER